MAATSGFPGCPGRWPCGRTRRTPCGAG
jgi:hypothetical protein